MLGEIFGQTSSDPFLMLITLSHTSFGSIYLVNNTENIISNGNTFIAFPCRVTLPPDTAEAKREARIEFDNASLELIEEIRTPTDPIDAKVQMVLASDPDTVEIELAELQIRDVLYNANKITARLILNDFLNTGLSSERYTPTLYPGIYS